MMTPDQANAGLELAWTAVLALSIRKLYVDRKVKGISAWHIGLTLVTTWWFIFFYAHLDQWFSFAASLVYALTVAVWIGMMLYFGARRFFSETGDDDA